MAELDFDGDAINLGFENQNLNMVKKTLSGT